jgi:hypothetical protein
MRGATLGKWMAAAALIMSGAVACGDDEDDALPSGAAGNGAAAGEGSGAHAGDGGNDAHAGAAGRGGACENGDCPHVDYCGPYPIEELCENPRACRSLDQLEQDLCGGRTGSGSQTINIYDTTCGGKVVLTDSEFGSDTWGFDEDGVMSYRRSDTDAYGPCPEGESESASTVWGQEPCEAAGPAVRFCGYRNEEGGAGGQGGSAREALGGAGGSGGAP